MSAGQGDQPGGAAVPLRAALLVAGAVALAAAAVALRSRPAPPQGAEAAPAKAMPTRLQPDAASEAEALKEATPVADPYRREVERPKPVRGPVEAPAAEEDAAKAQPAGEPASRRRDEKRMLPEIFRMPPEQDRAPQPSPPAAPREAARPETAAVSDSFAPFGRLVKCALVNTIDSVTARSEPIVALVAQDLDWNGRVVIPAGTEAFGYAKPQPVVDAEGVGRLVDSGEWTLVLPGRGGLPNGRELVLRARAVDRREASLGAKGEVRSWGIDDGADGLIGYTLSSLDTKELKLFAAAAISGMAQGVGAVAERQQPAPGVSGALGATQIAPTLGNALAGSLSAGTTEALNEMVSRIRSEIASRGVYVRIPAGKPFYLFVEQTIDTGAAEVGLRLPGRREAAP
jgi:hypothetical protein